MSPTPIVLGIALVIAGPTVSARHPTFALVVREQFAKWDLDHDGRLSASEIDELMNDRAIRGPAAAALAAIKRRLRKTPADELPRFALTVERLSEGPHPGKARPRKHFKSSHVDYEVQYRENLDKLGSLVPRLFAGEGPRFESIQQGPIGDCYFFSVTGSLARRRPGEIVRMIERIPHGDFVVRFPGGGPVPIKMPTQAEILVDNSTSSLKDGYWICVLEKAVGAWKQAKAKPGIARPAEITDSLASGGHSSQVIRLYSGHEVRDTRLRDKERATERLVQLRHDLTEALSEGRFANASMHADPPQGQARIPGLGYSHSYAVLAFDPRSDMITIWNPWGSDFTPKGPEGVAHGFVTRHGVFRLPLTEFYQQFSVVELETRETGTLKRGRLATRQSRP